jgi:hypothetical protein
MLYHLILLLSLSLVFGQEDPCNQYGESDCTTADDQLSCEWNPDSSTCVAREDDPECDQTDLSNWSVDPLGNSAQFRLVSTCSKLAIKVNVIEIVELDENGDETQHRVTSLASQDDSWVTNTETESGDTTSIGYTYSVVGLDVHDYAEADPNPIEFHLTTELYRDATPSTTDETDETSYMVKFGLSVVNWPWYNDETETDQPDEQHSLKVLIDVQTQRATSRGDEDSDTSGNPVWYTFNDGFNVVMNTDACLDDTTPSTCCTNVPLDPTCVPAETVAITFDANNKVHLSVGVTIPYFETRADYDPYLFWESNSVSRPMGLCALVAALVASLWML